MKIEGVTYYRFQVRYRLRGRTASTCDLLVARLPMGADRSGARTRRSGRDRQHRPTLGLDSVDFVMSVDTR